MKPVICLALAGGFMLPGCQSPSADFERLCRVAEEVLRNDSVARPEKATAIRDRFAGRPMHRRTRACVTLVFGPGLDSSAKYKVLEQCAHDAGASGWSCPALREFWAEAGQPVPISP
jgi:hypothetical protein